MSYQKYVICIFRKVQRPNKPHQTQLQCLVSSKAHGNTLFIVNKHSSIIPEKDVQDGIRYYCIVNDIIEEKDNGRSTVAAVSVVEAIKLKTERGAFWYQSTSKGRQWQHINTEFENFKLLFILDYNCEKTPTSPGQIWGFSQRKIVSVVDGLIIISVMLNEEYSSERRFCQQMKKNRIVLC